MKKHITLFLLLLTISYVNSQIEPSIIEKSVTKNQNLNRIDSIAKVLKYKGGDKVLVHTQFTINEEGQIVDIKARGPHQVFENEAIRIIKMIPQIEPPSLNGKPASPRFSLPIIFVIETEKQKRKRLKKEN